MGHLHLVIAKALVLARGLGTRMRTPGGVQLDAEQEAVAARGLKAMIPVGRPFLDFVLSGLADAGCTDVCLVIGPEHGVVREHYAGRTTRVTLTFAIQERPLGTADAVLTGEEFAAGGSVLVLNSDNLYPTAGLRSLASLSPRTVGHSARQTVHPAGLLGFRQSALLASGNIPPERIRAFALITTTEDGFLDRITEKPTATDAAGFGPDPLVSMNAWLLPPSIYDACREVKPSPRGELELQDAVRHAIVDGERFQVIESREPVLDLSNRADIPAVAAWLQGVEVSL